MTLVRSTRRSGPTWLVDGWTAVSTVPGGFDVRPADPNAEPIPRSTPSPGRLWILVPFVVLLAGLVLPFAILVKSRRAERRIRRQTQLARPPD